MPTIETSVFLAQFWGSLIVITSAIFLIRNKVLMDEIMESSKDATFLLVSGYLSVVVGLVTILMHNTWLFDWRGFVTVLGWVALFLGIARIGYPEHVLQLTRMFKRNTIITQTLLVIALLFGAWLIWASAM